MGRDSSGDRTDLIWKIDFTRYGDTIDQSPHDTIVPPRPAATDTAGRGALADFQRIFAEPATRLGNQLELGGTIGAGGVGVVCEANQRALDRSVAVKMLRPSKRYREAVLDLLREAWVTGSLEHPNVVPVYDLLVDEEGCPLIVLKRIEGVAWSDLISDAARVRDLFGAEDLLEWNLAILMQVLNAVRFAHSRGIVHRDLKPANVMIGEFGEVYLVDWGLAVSLDDDGSGRLPLARDATALAGTPCYMAPEMLGDADPTSNLTISERTDIYLVGSILYEILAGKPPHLGATSMQIVTSVVISSPDIPDQAPRRLADICRRAMDPDPDGRFENAEQVRLAIQGYLQHRGSERLSSKALAALTELEGQLARLPAGRHGDPETRQRLYRLYGECRFGFREALVTWTHNDPARAGLERATMAMVQCELDQGDPRAAAALCADLPAPPPQLTALIDQALAADAARKQRSAKLAELGEQLDLSSGQRARVRILLFLALCFTLLPAAFVWQLEDWVFHSHEQITAWNGFFLLLCVVVGIVRRDTMIQSPVNRRLYSLLLLLMVVQVPLELGLWKAGFSPTQSIIVHAFIWFFLAAIVAITFDLRLMPGVLAYLASFLIIAFVPDVALYIIHVPHAIIATNAALVWRKV